MKKISNTALDRIGDAVREQKHDLQYDESIEILNNWREAHGKIQDIYYNKCVRLAKTVDKNNIMVAQRLKRLPTIIGKLNRLGDMRLSSMQDIAGVRIIVEDMKQFAQIEKRIIRWRHLKRQPKNYVDIPKDDGYRGEHFVFEKNGMCVEVQLRTQLQHLWATSVETIDVFMGTSLKEGNSNTYWGDFFRQVSSIFAIAEGTPVVSLYKNFDINEIGDLLQKNINRHQIIPKIVSYAITEPIVDNERAKKAYYIVITLNLRKKKAEVIGFKESEYHLAFEEYKRREQGSPRTEQTVLVAINQIDKIREIYPNYFMNLNNFLKMIMRILDENRK